MKLGKHRPLTRAKLVKMNIASEASQIRQRHFRVLQPEVIKSTLKVFINRIQYVSRKRNRYRGIAINSDNIPFNLRTGLKIHRNRVDNLLRENTIFIIARKTIHIATAKNTEAVTESLNVLSVKAMITTIFRVFKKFIHMRDIRQQNLINIAFTNAMRLTTMRTGENAGGNIRVLEKLRLIYILGDIGHNSLRNIVTGLNFNSGDIGKTELPSKLDHGCQKMVADVTEKDKVIMRAQGVRTILTAKQVLDKGTSRRTGLKANHTLTLGIPRARGIVVNDVLTETLKKLGKSVLIRDKDLSTIADTLGMHIVVTFRISREINLRTLTKQVNKLIELWITMPELRRIFIRKTTETLVISLVISQTVTGERIPHGFKKGHPLAMLIVKSKGSK